MNVDAQMVQTERIDLSSATVADLIQELRSRCNAVVVCMVVDDEEDGDESVVTYRLGGRVTVLGALENAKNCIINGTNFP